MDARTLLPVQSSVIVTRPITDQEQTAQGGPARKWPMTVGFCCTISE